MNNGNLGERITIRLTPELRDFILLASASYGIKPAEFCRQCLYTARTGYMRAKDASDGLLRQAIDDAEAKIRKELEADGSDRTSAKHRIV